MILVIKLINSRVFRNTKNETRLQLIQLLTCDWLLETRTTCWEIEKSSEQSADDNNNCSWYNPVSSHILKAFQNDLNSLITVIEQIPVSLN